MLRKYWIVYFFNVFAVVLAYLAGTSGKMYLFFIAAGAFLGANFRYVKELRKQDRDGENR